MKLAYTMAPGRGDTDLILAGLARDVAALGLRCCGTVQTNTARDDCAGSGHCDMDVQVLPDGPVLRISQDLGPSARGCRLDPAALETAVSLVAAGQALGGCALRGKTRLPDPTPSTERRDQAHRDFGSTRGVKRGECL